MRCNIGSAVMRSVFGCALRTRTRLVALYMLYWNLYDMQLFERRTCAQTPAGSPQTPLSHQTRYHAAVVRSLKFR